MTTWVVSVVERREVRIVDLEADSKPIRLRELSADDTVEAIRRLTAGRPVAVDRSGYGLLLSQLLASKGVPVTTFNMAEARRRPTRSLSDVLDRAGR